MSSLLYTVNLILKLLVGVAEIQAGFGGTIDTIDTIGDLRKFLEQHHTTITRHNVGPLLRTGLFEVIDEEERELIDYVTGIRAALVPLIDGTQLDNLLNKLDTTSNNNVVDHIFDTSTSIGQKGAAIGILTKKGDQVTQWNLIVSEKQRRFNASQSGSRSMPSWGDSMLTSNKSRGPDIVQLITDANISVFSCWVFLDETTTGNQNYKACVFIKLPISSLKPNQCQSGKVTFFKNNHICAESRKCVFDGESNDNSRFLDSHYQCCCNKHLTNCVSPSNVAEGCADAAVVLQMIAIAFNTICCVVCLVFIVVVYFQRKTQDCNARGWALVEFALIGALLMYLITMLDYVEPGKESCIFLTWFREMGFTLLYGAYTLKIHRNLTEFRVRKAHPTFVKEKDLLKKLALLVVFTVGCLLAWTITTVNYDDTVRNVLDGTFVSHLIQSRSDRMGDICRISWWSVLWYVYELFFMLFTLRLCYKARSTSWIEKTHFTMAILVELVLTLITMSIRIGVVIDFHIPQIMLLDFIHIHSTVSLNLCLVLVPKFIYGPAGGPEPEVVGSGAKAHPSLAKLRDGLENGNMDFVDVPIHDMDPEDIRAELKRVYTQLRMYRVKSLMDDNPHIPKRKFAKKGGSNREPTKNNRRKSDGYKKNKQVLRIRDEDSCLNRSSAEDGESFMSDYEQSCGPSSPQLLLTANNQVTTSPIPPPVLSDLTVKSSPQNVYFSKSNIPLTKNLAFETDTSYRI